MQIAKKRQKKDKKKTKDKRQRRIKMPKINTTQYFEKD